MLHLVNQLEFIKYYKFLEKNLPDNALFEDPQLNDFKLFKSY
jgi:hypothetical protein